MAPRYRVTLTAQERKDLEALTHNGKTGAKLFIHARALLLCDAGTEGPSWKVADVAEALSFASSVSHMTMQRKYNLKPSLLSDKRQLRLQWAMQEYIMFRTLREST